MGEIIMIFLHKDKHHSFLQAGSIVFTGHSQVCPKYPKIASLECLCNTSKKGGMKLIFFIQINIKLSYKLIPLILVGMTRPAQIAQNPKLPKIASFQSLCNISRKR